MLGSENHVLLVSFMLKTMKITFCLFILHEQNRSPTTASEFTRLFSSKTCTATLLHCNKVDVYVCSRLKFSLLVLLRFNFSATENYLFFRSAWRLLYLSWKMMWCTYVRTFDLRIPVFFLWLKILDKRGKVLFCCCKRKSTSLVFNYCLNKIAGFLWQAFFFFVFLKFQTVRWTNYIKGI